MMNVNNITKRVYLVLLILFVLYSTVVFVLPFYKNNVFWLSYFFTIIAFAVQIYVFCYVFREEADIKSKFYRFPITRISVVYLVVQSVLGIISMLFATIVPVWIPFVLYVIMLGIVGIGLIAVDTVQTEIIATDQKLEKDISFMCNLQSKVNMLVAHPESGEICTSLEKFAESCRYSDPVSSKATKEIEQELSNIVDELQRAVIDNDTLGTLSLCRKAEAMLKERNRICKVSKR